MTAGPQLSTTCSVGEVAALLGVTVRTLHHYDEIGLVSPSERTPAGHRRYTDADLTRLMQVVLYRRLELPLEQIGRLLDGGEDLAAHLRRQRTAVMTRLRELQELVAAIDEALDRTMSDQPLTARQRKALFGDSYEDWQAQAHQRWGDTDAWRQSAARTGTFTSADWQAVKDEGVAIEAAFAAVFDAGEPATGEPAMAAAEAHRAGIARFYDCPYAMHRGLADMYLADPSFTRHYEDVRTGMAQYVHDAIHANADRHEA